MMSEVRSKFNAVVFGLAGFILALLVFRIGIDIINASSSNVLVAFIRNITDVIISPFIGITNLPKTGLLTYLNADAIIALIVYLLIALAISEFITSFFRENPEEITINLIDAIYKVIEFLLILRIVLTIFGVDPTKVSSPFVSTIYSTTSWSQGILFRIGYQGGAIDLSAIIVLVIVIVFDILTERFLESLFDRARVVKKSVTKKTSTSIPTPSPKPAPMPTPVAAPVANPVPSQQNITINVPVPRPIIINNQQAQSQPNRNGQVRVISGDDLTKNGKEG